MRTVVLRSLHLYCASAKAWAARTRTPRYLVGAGLFVTLLGFSEIWADQPPLAGTVLKQAVSGTTVHIDTPLGTKLPLTFNPDGHVTGRAGPLLASYLGSSSDRGRWWIEDDKLCQKWLKWFDTDTSCMRIWQEGARVRWYSDDGRSGTATIVADPVQPEPLPIASTLGGPKAEDVPAQGAPVPAPATQPPPPAPATATPTLSAAAATPPAAKPAPKKKAVTTAAAPTKATVKSSTVPLKTVTEASPPPPVPPAPSQSAEPPATVEPPPAQVEEAMPMTPVRQMPPAAYAPPPSFAPVAYRVAHVAGDDVLNIRSGPSRDAEIVGMIPPEGRGIRMLGSCAGEWCRVRYRSSSGWVNKWYLAADPVSADRER